jgi:hypothetical protein
VGKFMRPVRRRHLFAVEQGFEKVLLCGPAAALSRCCKPAENTANAGLGAKWGDL